MPVYTFDSNDSANAYDEWGANCGPNALAFALQIHIDQVRGTIPRFEERRYTNPTMMLQALDRHGVKIQAVEIEKRRSDSQQSREANRQDLFGSQIALVRIQWEGPWTEPNANPKWAYRQTHWIVTWRDGNEEMLFDVNGGMSTLAQWEAEIVPLIVAGIPRANGKWFPTHIWRLSA